MIGCILPNLREWKDLVSFVKEWLWSGQPQQIGDEIACWEPPVNLGQGER